MTVKAKRVAKGNGRLEYEVSASDILKADHPANPHFVRWLQGREASKRKARQFLQQFPQYRGK